MHAPSKLATSVALCCGMKLHVELHTEQTTSAMCCLPHWIRYNLHIAATVPPTMLLPSPCSPMWGCCSWTIVQHLTPLCLPHWLRSSRLWDWTDLCAAGYWTSWQAEVRWSEWATTPTESPLILITGAPQGCVLSPLLYSLYTHDCTATHSSNVIVKFADDTTVIGLITDSDETAHREEVSSTLTKWCQENHLSLNIDKTKELVVDYRRQSREHTPITIDKTPVERVSSFKFLGVHITEDLTWSAHTDAVLKKAHQRLFFLRRLRKFGTSPRILGSFYTCTVESILTGCITAWFGNSPAGNRKALQRVARTAHHIVGSELPSLLDIYTRRCTRKARRIIKDSSHPSHRLLSLLPSGRRLRSIRSRTSRLRDSFFSQAIRLMSNQK